MKAQRGSTGVALLCHNLGGTWRGGVLNYCFTPGKGIQCQSETRSNANVPPTRLFSALRVTLIKNIIKAMKSRKIRWARYSECMRVEINARTVLVGIRK